MAKKKDTSTTTFAFRPGFRAAGVTPDTAGRELERIRLKTGGLTPRGVVIESAPKKAPLHNVFVWDNVIAGDLYREQQARNLIRSIVIQRADMPEPVPVYVHVRSRTDEPDAPHGTYEPLTVVVQATDMFALALEELVEKMNSAARAVRQLEEAAGQAKDRDLMAKVAVAIKAIDMASDAVRSLH